MIYDSVWWKRDLLSIKKGYGSRSKNRRWTDKRLATLEKDIFIGFYIIRKLIEAKKLSDDVENFSIQVKSYPLLPGKSVDRRSKRRWDTLFDLTSPASKNVKLAFVCNQVIHSYIYTPIFESGMPVSFVFCSDWERNRNLFEMNFDVFLSTLEKVGKDHPNEMSITYDQAKKDYVITQRMRPL